MYEFYERLLQERGLTNYRVAKDTGIAQSVLSAWKNGASTPKADKMKTLAKYFGVPVEFFDNGKLNVYKSVSGREYYFDDKTAELAQDFYLDNQLYELVKNFKKLNEDSQKRVCVYIKDLIANPKNISEEKRKSSTSQVG